MSLSVWLPVRLRVRPLAGLLQLFVSYILSCLGGTLLTALMLGQPIGWLANDVTFGTYVVVFLLAFLPTTKAHFRAIVQAPILRTAISAMDDLSWGNSISTLGVQRVLHPLHALSPIKSSVSAAILGGITSGCGGGIIRSARDTERLARERTGMGRSFNFGFLLSCLLPVCRSMLNLNCARWSFTTPRHFSAPHWPIQLTSALSVLYYGLVNPHGYLPYSCLSINQGKWLLIAICVLTNTVWTQLGLSDLLSYGAVEDDQPSGSKRRVEPEPNARTLVDVISAASESPASPVPRARKSTARRSSSRKKA